MIGIRIGFWLPQLQLTLHQEIILPRMALMLASRALMGDEYTQLLYERSVLYDSLRLCIMASNDFLQTLAIRLDMLEVFN